MRLATQGLLVQLVQLEVLATQAQQDQQAIWVQLGRKVQLVRREQLDQLVILVQLVLAAALDQLDLPALQVQQV